MALYTITFETNMTAEQLHENLCLCIYEGSFDAGAALEGGVEDITLLGTRDGVMETTVMNTESEKDETCMYFPFTRSELTEMLDDLATGEIATIKETLEGMRGSIKED